MHGRWWRLRDPDKALAYLRQTVVNRSRSALRHRGVVDRHAAREAARCHAPGRGRVRARRRPARRRTRRDARAARPAARGARPALLPRPVRGRDRRHPRHQPGRGEEPRLARLRRPAGPARPTTWRTGDDPSRRQPTTTTRLADLLSDAVSDVEPANRLDAIRDAEQVTAMTPDAPGCTPSAAPSSPRPPSSPPSPRSGDVPGPGTTTRPRSGHRPATSSPSPPRRAQSTPPETAAAPGDAKVVPVYYMGDTAGRAPAVPRVPAGPRLTPLDAAAAALADSPRRSRLPHTWPAGSIVSVRRLRRRGRPLGDARRHASPSGPRACPRPRPRPRCSRSSTRSRPRGQARVGSHSSSTGTTTDQSTGRRRPSRCPTPRSSRRARSSQHHHPRAGRDRRRRQLSEVGAWPTSFEATVVVRILRGRHRRGPRASGMADGAMGEKLYPFSVPVDVSEPRRPATTRLVATTDDPSGGEGGGAFRDTDGSRSSSARSVDRRATDPPTAETGRCCTASTWSGAPRRGARDGRPLVGLQAQENLAAVPLLAARLTTSPRTP